MRTNRLRSQCFHVRLPPSGLMPLQGDGAIFLFVAGRQGVKRDFERGQGDIRGAAHQFKINRVLTPGTPGKKLIAQKRDFVGKAMVAVEHAVDAAFRNLVAAAKLRFCFGHTVARTYKAKFSLSRAHGSGPNPNRSFGCASFSFSCAKKYHQR